ncbi:MAG TPA: hypothetical protein VKT78_03115, partial [Fimbriimonadaceae bacterium]|nr:hypothetical protein [Fimbriimonadaceae bacterium]
MPQSKSNLFLWLNRALVPLASALSLTLVAVNLVQAGGHRQTSNGPPCQILDLSQEFYPATPLNYPRTSTRYSVQYSLNGGPWTTAKVHMSVYGQSMASPYHTYSKYTNGLTSMSFVNLPMANDSKIDIRVEKRWGAALPAKQFVTARPSVKPITIEAVHDRTVRLSTFTGDVFNGDQFILWYDSLPTENSAVEGLAFFLNPPTTPPSGTNVKVVRRIADLKDVSKYDTLDFEGTVGHNTPYVFDIPSNIKTVYLGDTAWLRGKIRFEEDGTGQTRKMYGNGVIDASRFDYSLRQCRDDATWFQWGWQALSFGVPSTGTLDSFEFDGFAVVDYN